MFVNFSNHPSSLWDAKQTEAAIAAYGEIKDIRFPKVDPKGDEAYIRHLAEHYFAEIMLQPDIKAVHIMGEQNLCFALIKMLMAKGIKCVASTTIRNEGDRPSFSFEQFREYE